MTPPATEPPEAAAPPRTLPHISATSASQQHNFAIAAGAIVGVLARFTVGELARQSLPLSLPIGTLLVNLLGCLLIGIVQTVALEQHAIRRDLHMLLTVGVLGGFTTFSTLSVETVRLLQAGQIVQALGYQALSLLGGIGAVVLGSSSTRAAYRRLSESQWRHR